MKYKNKHLEIAKDEYESKFIDYRDIEEKEMEKHINKKLGEFPIHNLLQEKNLNGLLWDHDAVSLYPSEKSDPKSIYPRIKTGYAFAPGMNGELVEKLNNQTFTQGSAILKIKHYNPKKLIVQHLAVKEREKKIEINRMRIGYIVDVLTSVDIQEIAKIGGKVIEN